IAGVIKTIIALETSTLPPTLHQATPNPRIAWDRLPVKVVDRVQPWPENTPRRAGVSSFGFSGTNAHVLLESVEQPLGGQAAGVSVLPFSAPDEAGLNRQAAVLADWM